MTISWNNEADTKLICAILTAISGPIDWNKVAATMGEGCTVSALKHRVARLRERVNNPSPKPDTGNPSRTGRAQSKRGTTMKSTKRQRKSPKTPKLSLEDLNPRGDEFEGDDLRAASSATDQENC